MENNIIIILGPPGSGKGTQAELLANTFNLYSFETSKILEESFNNAKEGDSVVVDGEEFNLINEGNLWRAGSLCSPPFVAHLVAEKIKDLHKNDRGIVFSGSPRTVFEAEKIIPLMEELYTKERVKVVFLDIPPEETIRRNSNRRICKLMRHPILFLEENKNITRCPLDGSMLVKREGLDDPEVIKVRIKEFQERTHPIVEFLRERGVVVNEVDGTKCPVTVFESIMDKIK